MNPEDPKVVALLLGEAESLSPEERAEAEALLAGEGEAEEIRKAIRLLREGFSREELPQLLEEQRRVILEEASRLFLSQKELAPSSNPWASRLSRLLQFPLWIPALAVISLSLLILAIFHPWPREQRSAGAGAKRQIVASSTERRNETTHAPPVASATRTEEIPPSAVRARAEEAKPAPTPPPGSVAQGKSPNGMAGAAEGRAEQPLPARPHEQSPSPVDDTTTRKEVAQARPSHRRRHRGKNRVAATPKEREATASTDPATGGADLGAAVEGAAVDAGAAIGAPAEAAIAVMRGVLLGHRVHSWEFSAGSEGDLDSRPPWNRNAFDASPENQFLFVREHPLSTFSADVDTASYTIVRRFLLEEKQLPPKGAVRIEELINYFAYDYPGPKGGDLFAVNMEVASCPWAPKHRLVRIGVKARELPPESLPPSNLVFLIDVSGSMGMPKKLPLVQKSLDYLIDQLGEKDQVGIVVYAGASGCVLLPTSDKRKIREALKKLEAGGSTNGASGIEMAYELAEKNFLKEGNNRVILATDGDWNVGTTSQSELLDLIAKKAKKKIYLTVLGFGMDNLNDSMLVKLADRGNGNYAYIDTLEEAHKVFGESLHKTLFTVAKDVKFQVEFNPKEVAAHRLIGYEKRLLAKEDFNDDTKDAGEIGAGHTVTVLYEIIPAGGELPPHAGVDPLKYQANWKQEDRGSAPLSENGTSGELLTVKIRYKKPDGEKSERLEFPLTDRGLEWQKSSEDFRFAAAVAAFGQLLKNSPLRGESSWQLVRRLAEEGRGKDPYGYRSSFLELVKQASSLPAQTKEGDEEG
ncbi:hypothetical protein MAMC_02055 [Methylacidimicrobium cyclopophantes]|uniref:VWFA domain-containing protein n=1 Tax=Methylacidimicrobium cyclopophantes TaxID=1041766 RepID=A0A5E6MGA6_9BACT|nr:von Willebrand factor type A domain-containing protein [Methylacidimicrobium cyclopophantes]VVM08321.1 hypothetical protein MAMC_02055 [Methylacidimicrobium cyclopophantes]